MATDCGGSISSSLGAMLSKGCWILDVLVAMLAGKVVVVGAGRALGPRGQ